MRRIRILFAVPVLAVMAALRAAAEMFGPASSLAAINPRHPLSSSNAYRQKPTWRSAIEAAYKALQARIDTAQRQPLLSAQRLWVQYRGANCGFYRVLDGSIRQVQAAECIRSMTEEPGA